MDNLIPVTLTYKIDDEPVEYTRKLTVAQIGQLLLQFDDMADDNDED